VIDPEHIAISKSKGIDIDWRDGRRSSFALEFLRDNCPCAVCTGAHGTEPQKTSYSKPDPSPFRMYQPRLKMVSVEPAGNYGVRIQWSDGHGSGIYSWTLLRKLSEEALAK
jgi:DUF971 family protein